jgi:hypothetical protein
MSDGATATNVPASVVSGQVLDTGTGINHNGTTIKLISMPNRWNTAIMEPCKTCQNRRRRQFKVPNAFIWLRRRLRRAEIIRLRQQSLRGINGKCSHICRGTVAIIGVKKIWAMGQWMSYFQIELQWIMTICGTMLSTWMPIGRHCLTRPNRMLSGQTRLLRSRTESEWDCR